MGIFALVEGQERCQYIPLRQQEIKAFKESPARFLDGLLVKPFLSNTSEFLPASCWYKRSARVAISLSPVIFEPHGPCFVIRESPWEGGYGRTVMIRQDGYVHGTNNQ